MYKPHTTNKSEPFTINIRLYLIVALGARTFLHEEIDTIYEANKLDYYETYKNSGFYDDVTFTRYTIDKEVRMKKVAGIVEWCYNHNDFDLIYKLIKKGYKFCWNFIKNRQRVRIDDFSMAFQRKMGGEDKTSESDLFFHNVVLLYLCQREGVHIDMQTEYGQYFQSLFIRYTEDLLVKQMYFTEENFNKNRERMDNLYERYFIAKKNRTIPLDILFDGIINEETKKINSLKGLTKEEYEEVRTKVFNQGISKYIGAYSGWLKVLGINEMDLTSSNVLTPEDLEQIMFEAINGQEGNQMGEEDLDNFVIACFFMKALAGEYNRAKGIYFNQLQDDFYYELREYEKELAVKEERIKSQQEEMKANEAKLKDENNKLWEELKRLQKENASLKAEKEQMEDKSKEVHALCDYIYSLEQENQEEESQAIDLEGMVDKLQQHKVVIIGGHPNWQNKIKETLPSFIVIHPDAIRTDLKTLDSVDAVFINTAIFSHKFYEKVMNQMSKNDTNLFYLNANNNIRVSVKNMYEKISPSSKCGLSL
ncbi:hypothetical protein PP175_25885 (plasmid) [Aneurinibacillus sp. Ricciae_BoGa-3]|uniref:hypothetical protein n=1 Tax=Aneurinibacillus sp. Ricciae_BoGa-3 TaxID=3022697 RepID=UPI002341D720|nr:hypothetical protein [Aneurinibacillus sp. Ricciae_BoGa-3]WCK57500.1 hypothetical protein PP175_25885 [Aneurinibacillus sp. Ricciae_BoGa-3]